MATTAGVLKEVADAAAIAKASLEVLDRLNDQRSASLVLSNDTDYTLEKTEAKNDHGGFGVTPQFRIPPRTAMIFGAQKKGGAFMTGCEGHIVYQIVGKDASIRVYWDNPYIGSNSSDLTISGSESDQFIVNHETGSGNKAEMRYELLMQPVPAVMAATAGGGHVRDHRHK